MALIVNQEHELNENTPRALCQMEYHLGINFPIPITKLFNQFNRLYFGYERMCKYCKMV